MKNLLLICLSYLLCISTTYAQIEASFTYNQSSNYSPTIEFTNTSTGGIGWLDYNWTYQDNTGNVVTFSVNQNPTYTFPSGGLYAITMTASDNYGSSDDFIQFINVECDDPITDFTINNQADPEDMTITFQNNSIGANEYLWDYGDGNISIGSQDPHTYSSPGTYSVCLTAISYCNEDTYCQDVTVVCDLPNASFATPQQTNPSNTTVFVSMNPSFVGSDSQVWDMGDGNTYTTQSVSHTYATAGTYNICLIAFNDCGQDVSCTSFNVSCNIPSADFDINASIYQSGVFGQEWFFDADDGGGTYDFGDGNTLVLGSSGNPISHTYDNLGTYNVCYTNSNNCGSNVECTEIIVNCIPPVSDFTYTQDDPSSPLLVNFTPTSIANEPAFVSGSPTYTWGILGSIYEQENFSYLFASEGEYTVSLTTTNSCGSHTTTQSITVECPPVTTDFTYTIDNNDPYTIHFSSTYTNGQFCNWDFGDGINGLCSNEISHTYSTEGIYSVCFYASNSCDSDQFCLDVEIDANPCIPPVVYNTVPTSTTTALATWEAIADATFYQVKYRIKGTSAWLTLGSAGLQKPISGLTPNKYYQYKMRSQCSDGAWSDFTDIQEFYTSTCEIPVGIASIYLDQTRVRIRWDANANTYKNIVRYREIGTATWLVQGNTPGKNFIYINGLNPNTDYEYRVRARCNDDTFSAYSDKYYFSTDSGNQVRLATNENIDIAINIYPNPVKDELNINYSSMKDGETTFIITDISGKTIQQQIVSSYEGTNTLQMNTSQLSKGYYIISIQNDGHISSQKFIKS